MARLKITMGYGGCCDDPQPVESEHLTGIYGRPMSRCSSCQALYTVAPPPPPFVESVEYDRTCPCCGETYTPAPDEIAMQCACENENCDENCPHVGHLFTPDENRGPPCG